MVFWLLLLGFITYFIVQRNAAGITRTPVWLLWLVMMTPAFLWLAWAILHGPKSQPPLPLIVIPFIASPLLYWFLVQKGRIAPTAMVTQSPTQPQEPNATSATASTVALPRLLNQTEETELQNCFPWSVYYLQNIEYRPQAVICRGQLRAASDAAYQTIQGNVSRYFGDRFLVIFQEGSNGKPFFALVPNPQLQGNAKTPTTSAPNLGLLILLLGVTLLTTMQAGAQIVLGPKAASAENPALWLQGLPYALALMLILGIHESGHYLMTQVYKLRATLPYFIPMPPLLFPLGTLGAFIQIRSPLPHRKALFDVGIAGPLAGFVATMPLLLWGLAQSTIVQLPERIDVFNFNAIDPSGSLLLLAASKLMLGHQLTDSAAIDLHPVAIAGYLGLLVTALNLMPVGQLDGGHIVHAMFGTRGGAAIGQISRLLFLLLIIALQRSDLLLWAILLFLVPAVDEPALNNVTELDDRRDFLGLIALVLLLLIILPAPKALLSLLM
jgi:membrane-associated protease RseP (regulator of RpoE activity)